MILKIYKKVCIYFQYYEWILQWWDNLQLQVQLYMKTHKAMDGKTQNFIWDVIVIDGNNPFIECIIYQY
jgi:hypothetical protein